MEPSPRIPPVRLGLSVGAHQHLHAVVEVPLAVVPAIFRVSAQDSEQQIKEAKVRLSFSNGSCLFGFPFKVTQKRKHTPISHT